METLVTVMKYDNVSFSAYGSISYVCSGTASFWNLQNTARIGKDWLRDVP